MMERGKEEKNEKGDWRNEGCMLWRGSRRGKVRGKLWIGVWMREKYWGNNKTSNFFKFQIMSESFTRST